LSRRFVQVAAKSTRVFDETKFIRPRPVASIIQTQAVASVLQTQTVASGQNSSRLFGRDKIWV